MSRVTEKLNQISKSIETQVSDAPVAFRKNAPKKTSRKSKRRTFVILLVFIALSSGLLFFQTISHKKDPTPTSVEIDLSLEKVHSQAVLFFKTGKKAEARELFESLIKKSPANAILLNNFALLLKQEEDFERAQSLYSKAIFIDPENAVLLNNYALLEEQRGKLSRAEKFFHQATELEEDNLDILIHLAGFYERQNQHLQAIEKYKLYIKHKKSQKKVRAHLAERIRVLSSLANQKGEN